MYYYIFDAKRARKKTIVEDIKSYLSSLGISGEFTYPSAAYTAEELVELGLSKKYNTIVGIGADDLAGKIANKLCGRGEAMGFIPLEASENLCDIIGAFSWREAAENLRHRKIAEIKIGRTSSGHSFLASVSLALKNEGKINIEFKDYTIEAMASALIVSNLDNGIKKIAPDFLDIIIQGNTEKGAGLVSRFSNIFGRKKETDHASILRARSLRLYAEKPAALFSGDEQIGSTPLFIESSDEDLRLIIGKKSICRKPEE